MTPNKYSRPQIPLEKVEKIAIHYIGNPNTSALANRNYFENQKNGGRYVSSHFIVGLKGEIIQCIPLDEWSYCTNQANGYSISIETCHPKSDGVFNDVTYVSLCELCAMLLKKFNLTTNDLIRHYDVTKKQCPLHWSPTKYQSEAVATTRWNRFKKDVQTVMNGGKVTRNNTVDITEQSIKENGKNDVSNGTVNVKPSNPVTEKTYTIPKNITFDKDIDKNVISTYSYKAHKDRKLSDHFKVKEFVSRKNSTTLYSDKVKIHNKLIHILEALYKELNCSKIIVNSGYRTPEHSVAVGGYSTDRHTQGRAADVVCYDRNGKIINAKKVCCVLEDMGGIYGIAIINEQAVHVDTRSKSDGIYFGDERKSGSPNILKMGYKSFHDYFNM